MPADLMMIIFYVAITTTVQSFVLEYMFSACIRVIWIGGDLLEISTTLCWVSRLGVLQWLLGFSLPLAWGLEIQMCLVGQWGTERKWSHWGQQDWGPVQCFSSLNRLKLLVGLTLWLPWTSDTISKGLRSSFYVIGYMYPPFLPASAAESVMFC